MQSVEMQHEVDAQTESRFGIESSVFFERFEKGEMGDDIDYMEWASPFQMYVRALASR